MKHNLRLIFIFLLALCRCPAFAQYNIPENKVWMFQDFSGLDFNTAPPHDVSSEMCISCLALSVPNSYEDDAPGASVSDSTGKLLFYTNGSVVWDSAGNRMPNANPLGVDSFMEVVTDGNDGALITGMPGNPGKYYVFSLTDFWNSYPGPGFLYYSVIDMQLNGGTGDAVPGRRWVQIDTGLAQNLVAVPGNNCNVWLIAHSKYTNMFKVYEITWQGVNPTPVVSYTGSTAPTGSTTGITPWAPQWGQWEAYQTTVSPDRTKLAASYYNFAELYDFDPATGVVSNGWAIDSVADWYEGISFSPDNLKLYVNRIFLYPGQQVGCDCAIDQFDLSQPTHAAIQFSQTEVAGNQYNGMNAAFGSLRLGPNGVIYYIGGPAQGLGTVEYPDSLDAACEANIYGFSAPPYIVSGQMGAEYVQAIPNPHPDTSAFVGLDTCMLFNNGDSILLHAPQGDFLTYSWSDSATDTILKVTQPGAYWVTGTDRCENKTIDTFIIKALPVFSLGADTTVCAIPFFLKADSTGLSYLWSDGSVTDSMQVFAPGAYWAKATLDGCSYTDTIQVSVLDLHQHIGDDTSFCRENAFQLLLTANAPPGANVLWSTGSMSPSITATDSGAYWVNVTDLQCEGSDTVHITAEKCNCHFGMPNAFSPNGDGKNDIFRLVLEPDCPIESYLINIYNRWGQLVFTGSSPDEGWDGTFNGQPQDIGTYMYTIDFTVGTKDNHYYQKGDVTLVR